jgi:ribosomal protein S25
MESEKRRDNTKKWEKKQKEEMKEKIYGSGEEEEYERRKEMEAIVYITSVSELFRKASLL